MEFFLLSPTMPKARDGRYCICGQVDETEAFIRWKDHLGS